jgi:hypothetical protein
MRFSQLLTKRYYLDNVQKMETKSPLKICSSAILFFGISYETIYTITYSGVKSIDKIDEDDRVPIIWKIWNKVCNK